MLSIYSLPQLKRFGYSSYASLTVLLVHKIRLLLESRGKNDSHVSIMFQELIYQPRQRLNTFRFNKYNKNDIL